MKIENIKFKAKRLDNGEWIIGSFVVMKIPALSKTTVGIVAEGGATLYEVDHSTVCQFTGLKDCGGTPIYEHDLLRCKKSGSIFEVVWNQGNASFSLVDTEFPVLYPTNTLGRMWHNRQLKVIGNKFNNDK